MRKVSVAALFLLPALALACKSGDGTNPQGTAAAASAKAAPAEKPREMSVEEAEAALPGIPMAQIPAHVRESLVVVAQEEFVFDGSPYTLAGCLKGDYSCKQNALRGLNLIAQMLNAGASRSEALTTYNRYYRSFEKAQRQTIDLEGAACKGPEDAPVTVVEFSDFECPHCAAARPVLQQLVNQKPEVRLCFMHFPLSTHSNAMSAAQATVFAHGHGKFWELHDKIFENQQRLSPTLIRSLAEDVGLDAKELVKAVDGGELTKVVEKQRAEGVRLGIQGTPSIYVNGRRLQLPLMPDLLRFTVEEELHWMYNGGQWASR